MEYAFSIYKIAEMAMQVEEEGTRFLNKLAQEEYNPKIKSVIVFLANQEAQHYKDFREIRDKSAKTGEVDVYVVDIAKSMKVFIDNLKRQAFDERNFKPEINIKKCLEVMIFIEEESIGIYQKLKNVFIDKFAPVLERIIGEEESHLASLLKVKRELELNGGL